MGVVTFRSSAVDDNPVTTAPTQIAIAAPTGLKDGDFLVASIVPALGTGTTITAVPAGWTLLRRVDSGTNISLLIYYKFALGEPARWAWTFSQVGTHTGMVRAYVGVDAFNPIDAETGTTTASTATPSAPSITTALGGLLLVGSLATQNSATFSAPFTGYTERNKKSQTSCSVEGADIYQSAAGVSTAVTATLSVAAFCATHLLALRPTVGTQSVDQVASSLKSFFPPGAGDWMDWDNQDASLFGFYQEFQAEATGIKAYGTDWVDFLRQEIQPVTSTPAGKLPDWEGALGISQATASSTNRFIATRQNAVLSALRMSGACTVDNIRAAIEPLLGYTGANINTLIFVETNRAALTTAHTYSPATLATVIPMSGSVTNTIVVPDDGAVSAAGIQLILSLTHANPEQVSVVVTGPTPPTWAGGPTTNVSVTFVATSLPAGNQVGVANYLYEKATSGDGTRFIRGSWTVQVLTGATAGTITALALFVEGAGRDAVGNDGLGAAAFNWGVQAEVAKVNVPDYVAVAGALGKIQQGWSKASLIFQTTAANGSSLTAIPDDANCIPDQCIPA